jgi:phosphoribosylformylglycinamidine synthase I
MKPKALVIRAAGTNCDAEMVRAFRLAGAEAELAHIDALIRDPARLEAADLVGFPGGFSYGDDIASGRILAMKARERLYPALRDAAVRGCPIIGACNGFQVLVQIGLLPGPADSAPWPEDRAPRQTVALADNIGARFVDRWVGVEFVASSKCVWTRGTLDAVGPADRAMVCQLPVAHGEGRFTCESPAVLASLEAGGRIAVRYTDNYNGSQGAVAGICDATGRVFGLMPHPERFLDWNRHPAWTRLAPAVRAGDPPGLRMFKNAVEAASPARASQG